MAEGTENPRFADQLVLCMAVLVALHAIPWLTGFKDRALRQAVEQGAAEAERRAVGETDEETIRDSIRTQQETLPFWKAIVGIGDFVVAPLILACRAAMVATIFTALAALFSRTVRFGQAMAESVACQWFWVAGALIEVLLTVVLQNPEAETSLVLLLPPGSYSVITWTVLRQVALLAIVGWLAMAWRAWRRGETSLPAAVLVCTLLAAIEVAIRSGAEIMIGAQMRLALPTG